MDDSEFDKAKKRLCDELVVGIDAFRVLASGGEPLSLRRWKGLFQREKTQRFDGGDPKVATGIWNLLLADPQLAGIYEESSEAERQKDVLPAGAHLDIQFSKSSSAGNPKALLLRPLRFKAGKNGQFECIATAVLVSYVVPDLDTAEGEARRVGVDPSDVRVHADHLGVTVLARSLNHAFSIASLRLETERISHTANIYDRLFWCAERDELRHCREYPLSKIRELAESGTWAAEFGRLRLRPPQLESWRSLGPEEKAPEP